MKTLRTSVLLWAMTFSGGLFAQSYPLQEASSTSDPLFEEGFLELPVPMQIEADISHQVVRYFIDFSCEFCKGLRDVMATWGQTLPEDYTLVYQHVGSMQSPMYFLKAGTLTYVMNSELTRNQKQDFIDLMFTHVQKVHNEKQQMRLIKEAVAKVGLPFEPLAQYLMSQEAIDDYQAEVELQNSIHVKFTPSILIGGKYLTHLGMTDGRPEKWIELINKITSIDIYSRANTLATIPNTTLQALPPSK